MFPKLTHKSKVVLLPRVQKWCCCRNTCFQKSDQNRRAETPAPKSPIKITIPKHLPPKVRSKSQFRNTCAQNNISVQNIWKGEKNIWRSTLWQAGKKQLFTSLHIAATALATLVAVCGPVNRNMVSSVMKSVTVVVAIATKEGQADSEILDKFDGWSSINSKASPVLQFMIFAIVPKAGL